jgi:hypothetical protein
MTETTFKLGTFFFSYVLPMIELDRLTGRFDPAKGPKQDKPAYEHQRDHKHKDFCESSHEVSIQPIRQSPIYFAGSHRRSVYRILCLIKAEALCFCTSINLKFSVRFFLK